MVDYYKLGQRIRKYRKAQNLSQEQLAEKVGISLTHMSHIETANTKLSLPVFIEITQALCVNADELLYDEPPENEMVTEEISHILKSASPHDLSILMDVVKAVKISLEKHKEE